MTTMVCFMGADSYAIFTLRDRNRFPLTGLADFSTASVTWSVARPSRKVGGAALPSPSASQEIGELMDERVLVADLQARHPPVLHVRMVAVGDVDAAPAAHAALRR